MRAVAKNTFYKKTAINQAVAVKPNFGDMADGGTDTKMTLKGGIDPTYFLLSGAVATNPAYGESEMVGGYLQLYTEGVTMPTTPSMPQLVLYRTKAGTEINEGTLKPSFISGAVANDPTGQDIAVYRSTITKDNYVMIENFDGADKTIGRVEMLQSIGNGSVALSDAYLERKTARDKMIGGGNIMGNRKTFSLKQFWSPDGGSTIPIEPEGTDPNGVWRPSYDGRQGSVAGVSRKTVWREPYWKYENIKHKIKFKQQTQVASDLDAAPLAGRGNTIFDEVTATADMNNPFTSDVNNPLMMTSCELSTAKKYSGGQAFRMYHLWDYSEQSAQLQKAMGGRAITPSMTRASIYNMPRPHPGLDEGVSSSNQLGWRASVVPYIEMRANISKLNFNPFMQTNMGGSDDTGFDTAIGVYTSGAISPDTNQLLGFVRSIAITFSNYKPKAEHTTLDKFLDYGLGRFYGTSSVSKEHVVGGIMFSKSPIDIELVGGNPANVTATTIPVTPYQDASGTSILRTQGMGKFGFAGGDADETVLLATNPNSSNDGTQGARQVTLTLDSWFNMKFFTDAYAKNTVDSAQDDLYNYGGSSLENKGCPMRVYFETEVDTSGTTETTALQNQPYLDIYFPAVSGGSSGSTNKSGEYSFNDDPAMFPKHMTIWVQNYRWISGTTSTTYADAAFDGSYGIFYWGDNNAGLKNGAATEAELFIDDIKFVNYTPEVTNCSIGGSINSQQYFAFGSEGQNSPFQTMSSGSGVNLYEVRGWAVSGQSTSGNLKEQVLSEQMIFGFDNPAQFPNATDYANDCYGYIMANGFSTNLYGSLQRIPIQGNGGISYISVSGTDINQKKLGGQFFGSHGWNDSTEASTPTGTALSGSSILSSDTANTLGGAATGSVNYATGTTWDFPSTDGFTQKGLFRVALSGAGFNGDTTWTKRENVSVSTKITGVMGASGPGDSLNANQIKVASTNIFNKYQDDEYVIYRIGQNMPTASSGNSSTLGWGVGSDEATAWPNVTIAGRNVLKLAEESAINEGSSIVTLDITRQGVKSSSLTHADDGSTDLLTEANLSDLWIGPKKYWLNLLWLASQTQRTYQNFCVVQNVEASGDGNAEPTAAAVTGSTWNESVFSFDSSARSTLGASTLYLRNWNLSDDPEDSTLVMNEDFGYGSFDETKGSGGQVSEATASLNNWVNMDMLGLAKKVTSGENITYLLGLADASSSQTVTLSSDENATLGQRPVMYWEYKDELPKFNSNLRVEPNYNILEGKGSDKVNLYDLDREELNAVKFTWEEEGEDILYRTLFVSTNPITNKYANIHFHAPMNEQPGTTNTVKGYYYTKTSRNSNVEFANATERTITGSSGWAPIVGDGSGHTVGPYTDTGWTSPWFGATTATFVAHCIPSFTEAGTELGYIMSDYDGTSRESVRMSLSGAAGTDKELYVKFQLTSGSAGTSGDRYTLLSDYTFSNDGESPIFIVVTFNAALPSNNIKMYVNGALAAQSAGNWAQDEAIYDGTGYAGAGRLTIGNLRNDSTASTQFEGTLQEIIVYDSELYVPTEAGEYVLPTDYLPDKSGDSELKYKARLFLYDYHNIIGTSRDTVCSSSEVTWEATGI